MADRRMWWGVGALTIGIGAALLTGSATALADTGSDSGGSHSSSSTADHDSAKSGSGSENDSSSPRHSPKATGPDSTSSATSTGPERNSSTTAPADNTSTADSSSAGTNTKATDQPSGTKRQRDPQRVVAQQTVQRADTGTTGATTDPVDHSGTKAPAGDPVSDPPTTSSGDVTKASTPSKPDLTSPSTSDPTALPRGPTAPDSKPQPPASPSTLAVVDPSTPPTATSVDPTPTPVEVHNQVVKSVSRVLGAALVTPTVTDPVTTPTVTDPVTTPTVTDPVTTPTVSDPVTTPTVSDPVTTPVQNGPVAALVSVDPHLVPMPDPTLPDPTLSDPTVAGTPTMRFAAMQTMAVPQLFSSALPTSTLTGPITPTVIQAPPTVGPIASAVLDILASFGWRASPLAVAIAPALAPWAANAAVPTPIPAVQDLSGTTPPTTADTVLVGHSTLYIPCGPIGYAARTDWYFPVQADGQVNPQGIVWVQNGFLANSGFYSALATNIASNTNSIVVVPTITSNPISCFGCWINGASMQAGAASLFTGNRQALLNSAIAAGYVGTSLPDPFILSGHSAGGGFVANMAADTIANGSSNNLKGVVMFDGVPGFGVMSSVAPLLRANHIPIYQIAAQNQIWNIWGLGTNELAASNPGGFNGVVIYHGSHVDSMLGGNPVVDFFSQLVTKFSPPGATNAVYTYADGWMNDMYAGNAPYGPPYPTPSPLYPAPNQPVQVGPAKAYGLPSPTGQRSTLGEIIYGIISFFSSLFGA